MSADRPGSGSVVADSSYGGAGGVRIFWRSWLPGPEPRAVVVIVHGAGEHLGRYEHVAARLTYEGYAVYAADHRGHGRSDGARALIDRVQNAVADLDQIVGLASDANPGTPVFMLGHSMGGLIGLHYAALHQDRLTGLVLRAPWPSSTRCPQRCVRSGVCCRVSPRARG